MQQWIKILLIGITVSTLILAASCTPPDSNVGSYAEDRALIEDLQARYMFALDFGDTDTYVSTFTEDGILDIRNGNPWQGREAIREIIGGMSEREEGQPQEEPQGPYPATGRHNITNIAIKIDGDKATGRAYWFHYGNNNPERSADVDSYGHYEDEMVKVDGQWLFSKRVIYNEQVADWIAPRENPCW
ncbi:MAG: nuclear transport factor 2 family protein [Acidobacteria bacterium]|nr:nuclear transport factor 2 family protein [Acidobacteriota bacterium]